MATGSQTNEQISGVSRFVSAQSGNLLRVSSIVVFLLVWWTASLFYSDLLLPGPTTVFKQIVDIVLHERFFFHFYHTFFRVITAFILGLVFSVVLGIVMGLSEPAEQFLESYILVGLTVPSLAVAMISLLIFGIGNLSAVIAIFAVILPPMTENMWAGAKTIDHGLIRMGNSFNVSRTKMITDVVLPQLVPYILAASRFGLGVAWKIAVIAELLGLGNGVGYKINEAFQNFSIKGVIAWTLTFTAVMFLIEFAIIKPLERRLSSWKSDVEGGSVL